MSFLQHLVTLALVMGAFVRPASGALAVTNLLVEYRSRPLGIDVERPRFSWQLQADAGERDVNQSACRIEVRGPGGAVAWDSGKIDRPESLHLEYAGAPLAPMTRYTWTATVWPSSGDPVQAGSVFETGLMDPSPSSPRWSGAQWIGGGDEDLVLQAPYLSVFDLEYTVAIAPGSTRASFVFGANDPRLMDRNKNLHQLENGRDQSYLRLEFDVSELASPDGRARLHVYRAGYTPTDDPARPVKSFEIDRGIVDVANAQAEHAIAVSCAFGQITITVDGRADFFGTPTPAGAAGSRPFGPPPNAVNLNPAGRGGDFLPFGLLCDVGFAVPAGQSATFRDVVVRHTRAPRNVLFREDLSAGSYAGVFADAGKGDGKAGVVVRDGRYVVTGGESGVFVVRDPSHGSMPMLRTTFPVERKRFARARLYVTARGIYEIYINGHRVGTNSYDPGLTQYNRTHLYQTLDVTRFIQSGDNAMGAMLGEGWWSGLLSFGSIWNHFGDRQSLLAKLVVTYLDGSTATVVTSDRTWKYFGGGPIRYGSLDHGEVYDARREAAIQGWARGGFDDRAWKPAKVVPLKGTTYEGPDGGGFGPAAGSGAPPFSFERMRLIGQIGDRAGVFRILKSRSVTEVRPGVFVYDLGQNLVGVPRVTFAAGQAGRVVTLRCGEMLYPDLPASGKNVGMILTENYRAALSQDRYVMRDGPQVFQPRFTSHGFRYLEITGLDQALPPEAVEGVVVSSVRELTADYRTSNPKVNRLWENLVWSNLGNFLSIPTDCPQRNERMGWSGDINVFSRTATYVSAADGFLARHALALRDVQTPGGKFTDIAPVGGGFGGVLWGSAGIVVPWETYLQYGDRRLLEEHYPAMTAYLAYLETTIDPRTGLVGDAQLGDWLGPQNEALGSAFLAAAYHAYDLRLVAQVAGVLGKAEDAAKYRARYEQRRAFFNEKFFDAEGRTLGIAGGGFGGPRRTSTEPPAYRVADTQTSYAVALGLELVDRDRVPAMAARLADAVTRENKDDTGAVRPRHSLMTGFIGTAWISKALSQSGRSDLAYRLLLNEEYPSWLYPVNQGATTIWERLNGYTVENGFGGNNGMNSFNHYSFGAVGQWLMAHSLGIERGEAGFRVFVLQPEPDPTGGLTSAEGWYDSPYGRIASAWSVEGTTLHYRATVPPNTRATLRLPTSAAESVREGGRPVREVPGLAFVGYENGKAVLTVASGQYAFTAAR